MGLVTLLLAMEEVEIEFTVCTGDPAYTGGHVCAGGPACTVGLT